MPTNHDETLQQRYLREHNDYVAMVKRMTPDQIMALDVELADVTDQRDQLLSALENAHAMIESQARQWDECQRGAGYYDNEKEIAAHKSEYSAAIAAVKGGA